MFYILLLAVLSSLMLQIYRTGIIFIYDDSYCRDNGEAELLLTCFVFLFVFLRSPFGVWYRDATLLIRRPSYFRLSSFVWCGRHRASHKYFLFRVRGSNPRGKNPGPGVQRPIRWISAPHVVTWLKKTAAFIIDRSKVELHKMFVSFFVCENFVLFVDLT